MKTAADWRSKSTSQVVAAVRGKPQERTSTAPTEQRRAPRRLRLDGAEFPKRTHYLLKYPAKFHPPVVQHLLRDYTVPGETVLDPFCGSGTLLLEAAVSGRPSIGVDIDPLAVLASQVKTTPLRADRLRTLAQELIECLANYRMSKDVYERRQFRDISDGTLVKSLERHGLTPPEIPNITHWFRRYVIADLARIRHEIRQLRTTPPYRRFFDLVFASIIRRSSNADPVPISGLEVTSHMRERDARGRIVDPFALFEHALWNGIEAISSLSDEIPRRIGAVATQGDAAQAETYKSFRFSKVITSPPYSYAVDYCRRHTLELYWLDFVGSKTDRLFLQKRYVGRHQIRRDETVPLGDDCERRLIGRIRSKLGRIDPARCRAFDHYLWSMHSCMRCVAEHLPTSGLFVLVIGRSKMAGIDVPTRPRRSDCWRMLSLRRSCLRCI